MAVPKRKTAAKDTVGLGALAVLVVGLGIIVYLAVPKGSEVGADGGSDPMTGVASDGGGESGDGKTTGALERLPEATCELAVLTEKSEVEVSKIASAENVAKLLDTRHCGGTCDALRKVMADHEHFEVELTKPEDYILPGRESYDTIAPGLTPAQRASIPNRTSTVVIRSHGASTIDQLPARVAFAATAALAEALDGVVYDEVVRRIETSADFSKRAITVPLGQNVFVPQHIGVQLYRQDDGTARLLTLGMVRFGSPDFTMRGSAMEVGPSLANVLNAVASWAAQGKTELPITISLAEVARVSGHAPADLAKDPKASSPVKLDAIDVERTEADPENEILELVPRGGATTAAWGSVVADLFGEVPKVVFATFDKELEAIAVHARRELPGAVKRFEAGEGKLYVKGPFPIPEASRIDGGAKDEWMWIEASVCDAKTCSGLLSNTPGYATNLTAGKPVTVARDKTADWMLRLGDGGTTGGESIKALQKRR
ncbi:MAG: hypothetical protein JWO86_3839 [Myxococcaceae bacterium]|nr:hypothetical protein [Myxococcaceae bacterium]